MNEDAAMDVTIEARELTRAFYHRPPSALAFGVVVAIKEGLAPGGIRGEVNRSPAAPSGPPWRARGAPQPPKGCRPAVGAPSMW